MLQHLAKCLEHPVVQQYIPIILTFLAILMVYCGYRYFMNGITFKTVGNYNQKLKNIGRPLPSYPNGWYIAAHSYDVQKNECFSVNISGQNLVIFRSIETGEPFILEAYCKHLGVNLGLGSKVTNKKYISSPSHGWIYDGQTGKCVDRDGKPVKTSNVQYTEDFCKKGNKLQRIENQDQEIKLKKYPSCQVNGYIYVWIHSLKQYENKPQYHVLDMSSITKDLQYRSRTIHYVKSHIQDIPENGADVYHFKYVHSEIIPNLEVVNFLWKAKWKRGDDPDVKAMFEHDVKYARDFKQMLYKQIIEPFPDKKYISIGYIDNYVKIPILGHKYMFNVTIIQQGCSLVYIFLKNPFFTIVFFHFIQPIEKYLQIVSHQCYATKWVPYWISALAAKMQGTQVTNDLCIWDAKKFGRNINFRKGEQADQFLKSWRQWYSQYYEGCKDKQKNNSN